MTTHFIAMTNKMSERREWLALVLSVVGGVVGFGVAKYEKVIDIFSDTSINIVIPAEYQNSAFNISLESVNLTGDNEAKLFENWPKDGVEALPGLYRARLNSGNEVVLEKYLKVKRGENTVWTVAKSDILQHMLATPLALTLTVPSQVTVGQEIPVSIKATGNGYIWLYELDESDKLLSSFPTGNPVEIRYGQEFSFADQNVAYYADKPGDIRIIAILTASAKRTDADALLASILGQTKKSLRVRQNWATSTAHITVNRP